VQIEETGLPAVEIPVSVSVWAASNPDEEPGPLDEIRRQLSDRFDLIASMGRPATTEAVVEILLTNEAVKNGQPGNRNISPQEDKRLRTFQQDIASIAGQNDLVLPAYLANFLASIYINFNVESLRALEAIAQAALLHAALRKRNQLMISDVMAVLPLVLCHRVSPATLAEIMHTVNNRMSSAEKAAPAVPSSVNKVGGSRFAPFFNRSPEKQDTDRTDNDQPEDEESPPQKARYLRDALDRGAIKKEYDREH
jgi:magnesium chelatase subunit I